MQRAQHAMRNVEVREHFQLNDLIGHVQKRLRIHRRKTRTFVRLFDNKRFHVVIPTYIYFHSLIQIFTLQNIHERRCYTLSATVTVLSSARINLKDPVRQNREIPIQGY